MIDKLILWLSLFVAVVTYSFWSTIKECFGFSIFYIGNSFLILLLCSFIFNKNRSSLACFLMFGVALNNFLDELLFSPTDIQFNEFALLTIMPIIWHLKMKKYA